MTNTLRNNKKKTLFYQEICYSYQDLYKVYKQMQRQARKNQRELIKYVNQVIVNE